MIVLDSTAESITWQLSESESEPKLKIDKYQVRGERGMMSLILTTDQVSCWDHLTTNHQRDLPCCSVTDKE